MNLAYQIKTLFVVGCAAYFCLAGWGLSAYAQSFSIDGQDVLVVAEEIFVDQQSGITRATGNVELTVGDQRVMSQELIYDEKNGSIIARGSVYAETGDGQRWLGEEINLSEDFTQGEIQNFRIQFNDKSRVAAAYAEQDSKQNVHVKKAVFSPCPSCEEGSDKPLLWQIRSEEAELNAQTKQIIYNDLYLDFLGQPVVYLPTFRQADPRVDRMSGIIDARTGWSSLTGPEARLEYFWALGEERDLTIESVVKPLAGFDADFTYRRAVEMGSYSTNLDLSYVGSWSPYQADLSGENNTVLEALGGVNLDFDLSKHWRLVSDLSWLVERTRNVAPHTALGETDQAQFVTDWATSTALEGFHGPSYTYFGIEDVLDVNQSSNAGSFPTYVSAKNSYVSWGLFGDASLEVESKILGIFRSDDQDTGRISFHPSIDAPYKTDFGLGFDLEVGAQLDYFFAEASDQTNLPVSGSRIAPNARLGVDYEMIKAEGDFVQFLVPSASVTATLFEDSSQVLPNEDAFDMEIDVTNFDWTNRSSGTDLLDTGIRANLGLEWSLQDDRRQLASIKLGASQHLAGDDVLVTNTELESSPTILVGDFEVSPIPNVDIDYRFTADLTNADFRRQEVTANLRSDLGSISASYHFVDPMVSSPQPSEVLLGSAKVNLGDYWSVASGATYDLIDDDWKNVNALLSYAHPCLDFSVRYDNSLLDTGLREHKIGINLDLLTLGNAEFVQTFQ